MNVELIKNTIDILKPNGQLYEIRILKGKTTISGYFRGTENLDKAFSTIDLRGANVFYTLQSIDDACYSREQHECFRQNVTTTSDSDIVGYNWLLVDLDPKRSSGVSSTDAELNHAKATAQRLSNYLTNIGFEKPIIALSGNGVHLLYSVSLSSTQENRQLMERCLKALAYTFNDEHVDVDVKVFNPARVSKLYGTLAQKGANTSERPHRYSRIVQIPKDLKATDRQTLVKLAESMPNDEPVKIQARTRQEFNLDDWIAEHGIRYKSKSEWNGCTKYVLDECPFDGSHKAPDSCLLKMSSGAIAFKCLHNSCAGRTWQELRLMYEPDAYDNDYQEDDGHIDRGWQQYKAFNRNRTDIRYEELKEETPDNPMFETMMDIVSKPKEERVTIATGYGEIDKRTGGGLAKGEISVVSGLRAAAKSTWLSQIMLNAVNQDYRVLCYSGELKDKRFGDWLMNQAAGIEYIKPNKKYIGLGYLEQDIKNKIAKWMGDKFFLYNNDYGNNFSSIATRLQEEIKKKQIDLVVIDNMMILDLSKISNSYKDDKYEQQKLFVEKLKSLSMLCNCHIIFVAHPRKAQGFLRLDDISGTGNIGNLVDNAFIVHRNNADFQRLSSQMFRWKDNDPVYDGTNVVEIAKEREFGNQDVFIPLWFEQYSRRLLNYENEHIVYGWDAGNDGFIPITEQEELPWET